MENDTREAADLVPSKKSEEASHASDSAHVMASTREALRLITGKWKGEIMWHLKDRKYRFGELKRAIPGITQHMLTAQLRDLESHGLVIRTVYPEVPLRVEYEMTPVARDLKPVFDEIRRWADQHADLLKLRPLDDKDESPSDVHLS